MFKSVLLLVVTLCLTVHAEFFILQSSKPERGPIVNLFQWSYDDIANECEYLKRRGFGGVQVSPVTENIEVTGHPWTEKYEPISYKISSRAGSEDSFYNMIQVCSDNDIKIYVEVVLNHMTKKYPAGTRGYAGSSADTEKMSYPAVPYTKADFHTPCKLEDINDLDQVLKCQVDGRLDLDQSKKNVRQMIINFLNRLIDLGVAGFSINAAGHISYEDLLLIYQELDYLNTDLRFRYIEKPFVYHEVIEKGAIRTKNYQQALDPLLNRYYTSPYPHVTDFKYSLNLQKYLTGQAKLKDLRSFESYVDRQYAIVFLENHLTQRGLGLEGSYLTVKSLREYRLATALMLVLGYGTPVIMSGYTFSNQDQGPPSSSDGKLLRVETKAPEACKNGWTCEHRDKIISKLVRAAYLGRYSKIDHWWDNGANQIAFRKGGAFYLFNLDKTDISLSFQTGLPVGHYCDVFTGEPTEKGECSSGSEIYVYNNGTASISLKANDPNGAVLIYDESESHIPFGLIMDKMKRQWHNEAGNLNTA